MSAEENRLREQITRFGKSIFERGLTAGSSGNISVRLDDGWLLTPTNACLGTLDPARDKPELLGRYAENFHPRFAALSGSEAQTKKVATAYKVYFEKVPVRGTNQYSIDHTSFTYVLDAEGRFAGFFPPGTSGARIAERVRAMLPTR